MLKYADDIAMYLTKISYEFEKMPQKMENGWYVYNYNDANSIYNLLSDIIEKFVVINDVITDKNIYKLIGTIDPIIRRYCLKKDCYIDKTTYDILYKAEIQTIKNIKDYFIKHYIEGEALTIAILFNESERMMFFRVLDPASKTFERHSLSAYATYCDLKANLNFEIYDIELSISKQFSFSFENSDNGNITCFGVKNFNGVISCDVDDEIYSDESWGIDKKVIE